MNSDRKVQLVTLGSRLGWYNWDSAVRLTDPSGCNQGSNMTSDLAVWPELLCWVTNIPALHLPLNFLPLDVGTQRHSL